MTKSELIKRIKEKYADIFLKEASQVVTLVLDEIADALVRKDRVELRGFGSFSLRERAPRAARNPKTGEVVDLGTRHSIYFRAGKELRERLNS